MLIYYRTSILESSAQTVVNTVNCVGVMGKGIAHAFKVRYPDMFRDYKKICDEQLLEPGLLWLWRGPDQWVLNFPTKRHWRHPSQIEWIEAGLKKFVAEYEKRGITEISFPRLGCGNGGLDWGDVRPIMERYLTNLPITVYIHDHEKSIGLPEHVEAKLIDTKGLRVVGNYHEFTNLLRLVIDHLDGSIAESKRSYRVQLDQQDALSIVGANYEYHVDSDHLRGLWTRLKRGLLTQGAIKSTAGAGADQVMCLFSYLPDVRPVEVQRLRAPKPEVALELVREARIGSQSWAAVDA